MVKFFSAALITIRPIRAGRTAHSLGIGRMGTDGHTPTFSNTPAVVEIPNSVRIALLGDCGGNNTSAREVASSAKARVGAEDVIVHLGDVYYAGTKDSGFLESD